MCLEHKQYWQCCLSIDSKYIDPCPQAIVGERCTIDERVHPIGGYCTDCRRTRNKCEDDIVTSPMYSKNDGYDRPWQQQSKPKGPSYQFYQSKSEKPSHRSHESKSRHSETKYKPVKSQPLPSLSSNYGPPKSDRGRSPQRPSQSDCTIPTSYSYRKPSEDSSASIPSSYSFYHTQPRHSSPGTHSSRKKQHSYDDDSSYKGSSKSKHSKTSHRKRDRDRERGRGSSSTSPKPVRYRIASPRTIELLQRQGVLPRADYYQHTDEGSKWSRR